MKRRREVDRDDRVPFLGREILNGCDVLDAGIVDQDVGAAELFGAALDHSLDFRRLGHVGAVVDRAQLLTFAIDIGGVAEAVDHQLRALASERLGDREADARGRARHESNFAFKKHAVSPSWG